MNSATAIVTLATGRFIAKWVHDRDRADLIDGALVARSLNRSGLRTGEPFPTFSGDLTVSELNGQLVLLAEVPGEPLTTAESDQTDIAALLGQVHHLGRRPPEPLLLSRFSAGVDGLDAEPWVRAAVGAARAEIDALPPLTWSTLHTDPAPEAFRRGPDGTVGLIDWAGAKPGPVLYDVASTVMYLGGPERASTFLDVYLAAEVIDEHEATLHLSALRRFRAAVQAAYFSRRISNDEMTGIVDPAENVVGLHDARRMLVELDAEV